MVGYGIQQKVSGITASDAPAVDSQDLNGYFYRKDGKFFGIEDKITADIEETTRFVCQVLSYSPGEVWRMNIYEFYRDLMRANVIIEQRKSEMKKWQKNK